MSTEPTDPSPLAAAVRPGECLGCYLVRMIEAYGCRGHGFTKSWIAAQQPRPPRLLTWLKRNGGCCCDCEVIYNVLGRVRVDRYTGLMCDAYRRQRVDPAEELDELDREVDPDDWAEDGGDERWIRDRAEDGVEMLSEFLRRLPPR